MFHYVLLPDAQAHIKKKQSIKNTNFKDWLFEKGKKNVFVRWVSFLKNSDKVLLSGFPGIMK